jgi:hypothetical protein
MSNTAFYTGILCPALRRWRGYSATSYLNKVLGSTPQTWLNGLALSHVLYLTLSGMPKILLYCTEYNRPRTLAPTNEESWAQWGKNPYRKNNLSIESSEVNVWLVWILTTKRKSLKRVETCQKRAFHFLIVCYVNSFFRFNLSNGVYSLDIYTYPFNLFRIEPLIVHSYLNDIVVI